MTIKIFISHATADKAILDDILIAVQRDPDIEVLIAPLNVPEGAKFMNTIDDMINTSDIVVAVVTKRSLESAWVVYELSIARDRNKFIIPVVTIPPEQIPFFLREFQSVVYQPNTGNQQLSSCLKNVKVERGGVLYPWHHLRERRVTRIPFLLGLFIANLGFLSWWALDAVWALYIRSGGKFKIPGRGDFTGLWPSIWAASSLFTVYVAVCLIVRMRRGTVGVPDESLKWILGGLLFLASTAVASYFFYNLSGIDTFFWDFGPRNGWNGHTVELLSTSAWSMVISGITVLPFLLMASYWRNVLAWKPLVASIAISALCAILTLCVYFAYMVAFNAATVDHDMRGKIVGAGLRSGMFIGIYFAAVLSSIKAEDGLHRRLTGITTG